MRITFVRKMYGLNFLICAGLWGFARYLESQHGLHACLLCLLQRYLIIAIGAVSLFALVINPVISKRPLYGLLTALMGLLGAVFAGRQLWLQIYGGGETGCLPGLKYVLQQLPFKDAVEVIWQGSGECAQVQWQFLTISIPGWTLMFFLYFIFVGLWLRRTKRF